ncbi:hypothetical protein ACFL15_00890 [Patescibacteria group bacterium]
MDIKKSEIAKDYLIAVSTAELFLPDDERKILDNFLISVYCILGKLTPDKITDLHRDKAIKKASEANPDGKKVFDKWINFTFSAVEPKNKPNG